MLTECERKIIMKLKQSKIPHLFKYDYTDNILFVEHVEFDLCDLLIKNKIVNNDFVQKEIKAFSTFLYQLNVLNLDEESKTYLDTLMKVVHIFIIHNLSVR